MSPKSPTRTAAEYLGAAKAAGPSKFKMAGTGSKQEDQILTVGLEKATGTKFIFVPYKEGGGDEAVQPEDAFRQSMLMSQGELGILWAHPLVASIAALAMLLLFWPLIGRLLARLAPRVDEFGGRARSTDSRLTLDGGRRRRLLLR